MIIPDLEEEENEWMNASLGIQKRHGQQSLDKTLEDIKVITKYFTIKELTKSTPNDQELGEKIRKLINDNN